MQHKCEFGIEGVPGYFDNVVIKNCIICGRIQYCMEIPSPTVRQYRNLLLCDSSPWVIGIWREGRSLGWILYELDAVPRIGIFGDLKCGGQQPMEGVSYSLHDSWPPERANRISPQYSRFQE